MTETRLGSVLLLVTAGMAAVTTTGLTGCMGSVGESQPAEETGGGTPPGENGALPTGGTPVIPGQPSSGGCQEAAPLVTAARRLTRDQYVNTVRDLIGDAAVAGGGLLPRDDIGDNLFADPRTLIVSPDWASNAMDAAEAAAKAAVANMSTLLPCDPAGNEAACLGKFITSFGKRAFRRPLEGDEVAALEKLHAVGAKNGGFAHGIEVVVRALLQAPSFLYRLELGQKSGTSGSSVRLGSYEVASRLSYLLWNTMPDKALLEAADSGKLATADEIVAQARRLLADPRAKHTLGEFHGKWLGIDGLADVAKDPAKYPQYDAKLISALRTELQMFIDEVLWKGGGRFESLFDSTFTFVDASLAPLYGVPAPAGGAFARVELDRSQRRGVLTNAGVLTAHTFADESEPIHRGKFVRENFLCTIPPDPPADLMVEPPQPKPGVSTRERLAEHTALPACRGCHQLMDPIGHGFEGYDGLGRFRTSDSNGRPVDDNGVLALTDDIDGPFKGALELGQKLSGSAQVRACMITNVLRFAQGLDAANDSCARQKLAAAFEASQHDIRELFIAVARTDGFRFRRAIEGEVLP